MLNYKFLYSILVVITFFLLATATSPEEELLPFIELNLIVDTLGTNIFIENIDTVDIEDGYLLLYHFVADPSTNNGLQTKGYSLSDYQLLQGEKDTIPFADFTAGMEAFPNDSIPSAITINSYDGVVEGGFQKDF